MSLFITDAANQVIGTLVEDVPFLRHLVEKLAEKAITDGVIDGSKVWLHAVDGALIFTAAPDTPADLETPGSVVLHREQRAAAAARPALPTAADLRGDVLDAVHRHLGGSFDSVQRIGPTTFKVAIRQ